jgi:hypothetical protein
MMKTTIAVIAILLAALLAVSCTADDNNSGKASMKHTQESEALAAIKSSYGTEDQEYGVTLFVNHHLEELDGAYWKRLTGTDKPTPQQVLDQLIVINKVESDGEITYDFSLPGGVTQYVISVIIDADGNIQEISMES